MITNRKKLDSLRFVLRLTYGVIPIVAGLDKFFNILTNWEQYLNPTLAHFLPFSAALSCRSSASSKSPLASSWSHALRRWEPVLSPRG